VLNDNGHSWAGDSYIAFSHDFCLCLQGISILTAIDDIQLLLDDHIVKAQTMKGSPFIKPFETEMNEWETKLVTMQDILDNWLKVNACYNFITTFRIYELIRET
jgi:Dynein heavy chain, N-terminal region 2